MNSYILQFEISFLIDFMNHEFFQVARFNMGIWDDLEYTYPMTLKND